MDLSNVDPDTVQLVLKGIPLAAQHHEKITTPAKKKINRMRGRGPPPDDPDVHSDRIHEDKGYVLRKRSEVQSDEEIVEVVRHRGQRLPKRPGLPRHSSSMDDIRGQELVPYRGGGGGRKSAAAAAGGGAGWDSDSDDDAGAGQSRGRGGRGGKGNQQQQQQQQRQQSRGRAKSANGAASGKKNRKNRSSSSSSSSSSSVCSSTDDEKRIRKAQRKKWITAGLAGVATVHAAAKVYSSIEAHDKRMMAVQQGDMSPEEAHKKGRASRWQDAAAIAIAALGIKGAISEWNETMEEHAEHKELMRQREEHHKKRLEKERRSRAKEQGGYYKGRDGGWYYAGDEPQGYGSRSKSRGAGTRRSETY